MFRTIIALMLMFSFSAPLPSFSGFSLIESAHAATKEEKELKKKKKHVKKEAKKKKEKITKADTREPAAKKKKEKGFFSRSLGTSQSSARRTTGRSGCCKVCTNSKACGDSCISNDEECRQPKGCACE